jgi:hypothetical protein
MEVPMKKLVPALVILTLVSAHASTNGQQKKPSGALAELMQKKLKNSQMVLEGIVIADFPRITRSAEELIQLSKTTEWFVLRTPRFELHTNEFRRAADNLIQKAKDKNVDGAAFAYFELTMSCVRCHQYVRDVRDARGPDFPARPPVHVASSQR